MNRKKTSPQGLYLKELKKNSCYKHLDIIGASQMYKTLSPADKEYYDVLAKRINDRNASENTVFTTQKDTIGSNLKEVTDRQARQNKWEKDMAGIIKDMAEKRNVLERQFVVVQVGGVYFSRAEDCQSAYAASEISFIKFSFRDGIKDSLVLFPECLKVAIGYRESLYEDLEESVGWRPDTFKNNHPIEECSKKIREFFEAIYDPIFVASKNQQEEVGMALYNLYNEIGERCPWLHDLLDWGQYCTIYRLDMLVANVINDKGGEDSAKEQYTSADVREHWLKINVNTASECCERHQQYGLPNQCPHDISTKNLYSSFLLMVTLFKDKMRGIREIVSDDFFNNLDFILSLEQPPSTSVEKPDCRNQSNHYWNNYVFDKSGIEDVINRLEAISVNESSKKVVPDKPYMIGRGRGMARPVDKAAPGTTPAVRKLKLPKVIC